MPPSKNRLNNGRAFLDGYDFFGRTDEITLPDIKAKTTEDKGMGSIGTSKFFTGLEALEAKFKMGSFYPETIKAAGNPRRTVAVQVRSNLETHANNSLVNEAAYVVHLRGRFTNFPLGALKAKDPAEFDLNMDVDYIKLVVGGQTLYEVDVVNNIWIVDGVDLLATFRANLGG